MLETRRIIKMAQSTWVQGLKFQLFVGTTLSGNSVSFFFFFFYTTNPFCAHAQPRVSVTMRLAWNQIKRTRSRSDIEIRHSEQQQIIYSIQPPSSNDCNRTQHTFRYLFVDKNT